MPLYEYACEKCKKVYEIKQSITEDALTECPEGHTGFKRLISATSFVLKGSGWYKTDYAGGSTDTSSSEGGSDSSAGGGHSCGGGACGCA